MPRDSFGSRTAALPLTSLALTCLLLLPPPLIATLTRPVPNPGDRSAPGSCERALCTLSAILTCARCFVVTWCLSSFMNTLGVRVDRLVSAAAAEGALWMEPWSGRRTSNSRARMFRARRDVGMLGDMGQHLGESSRWGPIGVTKFGYRQREGRSAALGHMHLLAVHTIAVPSS